MAQRTPRLCWQNYFAFVTAVLTSSSEDPSAPARWLKDGLPSKAWGSKLGWNIVASENDRIDFEESVSGVRAATLTAGNYATGTALPTEAQTRINAVAVDNTYTVTYSASTNKFTISRATGSANFKLLWSTGTNKARSVGPCMGYSEAADSAMDANPKVGDYAVYHSQEWLTFDLTTARLLKAVLAYGHNVGSLGSITVMANSSDSWTSPAYSVVLEGTSTGLRGKNFTDKTYRYWRLLIEDQRNPGGVSYIGIVYGGSYLQPGRSILRGYSEDREELSQVSYADQGAGFMNEKDSRFVYPITFPRLTKADKIAIDAALDYLKVGRPFFFEMDPQNDLPGTTYYVALRQGVKKEHSVGDGDPPERWTISMDLEEVLG